jgi:hypothetical protein
MNHSLPWLPTEIFGGERDALRLNCADDEADLHSRVSGDVDEPPLSILRLSIDQPQRKHLKQTWKIPTRPSQILAVSRGTCLVNNL